MKTYYHTGAAYEHEVHTEFGIFNKNILTEQQAVVTTTLHY